jgi:hypothetical protein
MSNNKFGSSEGFVELSRGITGFRDIDDSPLPLCDLREFRGHCFAVARDLGGRVCSFETPLHRSNFASAVLEFPSGRIAVLLNAHFPVIAFAEPLNEDKLRFLDSPELGAQFRGFNIYTVSTVADLTRPLSKEMCQHLAPAERKQVDYWRPACVGELMFNFWD